MPRVARSSRFFRLGLTVVWIVVGLVSIADARGTDLVAYGQPNSPIPTVRVEGSTQKLTAWQISPQMTALRFGPKDGARDSIPEALDYLKVTYLDRGYGRLAVTCKATDGSWQKPDKFTRVVLLDSGKWVDAYFRFDDLPKRVPEIRVQLEQNKTDTLLVSAVVLQDEPFADAHFRYLLEETWRRPYDGPTRPNDNGTLRGKVMVGYQGWFRTPNDPYDASWVHWGDIAHGTFSVDMWPDVSFYPLAALDKAADVRTRSGQTAFLFSSAWPETVDRHFALMRQYDIDGAFVQRFVSRHNLYALGGSPEWVLGNVRAAANREGRLWAVEYDVSGCPDGELLDAIKKDWAWLVDDFGIRGDAAYAREGVRPVVFVWGLAIPDRKITPETANAVVDFLKHDPVYGGNDVIGGIIGSWRSLSPVWQEHLARYDSALPWQSTRYPQDVADLKQLGVVDYPHVWPGFSWANLKHLPANSSEAFTPRAGGEYYEKLLRAALQSGADRLFVGMFDEYDEGTAILPMSDDPPLTPTRPGVNLHFAGEGNGERAVNARLPAVELTLDGKSPFLGIPATDCTLRFEGQIVSPTAGQYSLRVEGAEGDQADLSVGPAHLRIDEFPTLSDQNLNVTFAANEPIPFQLEYQHRQTSGRVRLLWAPPGEDARPLPASAYREAWGRFLTNEGRPADHWLALTAKWKAERAQRLSTRTANPP